MKKTILSLFLATNILVASLQLPLLKTYAEESPISSAITSAITSAINTVVIPAITSPITSAIIETVTPKTEDSPNLGSQTGSNSGNNNSTQASSGSNAGKTCTDIKPNGIPILFKVLRVKNDSVKLFWTMPDGPLNSYSIVYGRKPGLIEYSTEIINGKETINYTINALSKNNTYYFRVRAFNNCMPGEFSNELKIKISGNYIQNTSGNSKSYQVKEKTGNKVVSAQKQEIKVENTEKINENTVNENPVSEFIKKLSLIFFNR